MNQVERMNYFWGNLFERWKERQNAGLFFWGLALLPVLILAGAGAYALYQVLNLAVNWPLLLPVGFLLLVLLIWRGIRREQAWRKRRYKMSPLSRDELAKARSKLKTHSVNRIKT